jgi:hypothetical protein
VTSLHRAPRAPLGLSSALLLCGAVACSGARGGTVTEADAGTPRGDIPAAADVPVAADLPAMSMDVPPPPPDVPAAVDLPPPARDVSTGDPTYPAGPYGSSVGRLFQPFSLTACNREGADATWRFDGPDFFTNQLTVISIAAAWCVPCQRETMQLQEQIITPYAGRGVRFVQLLVQNTDGSAISPATCRGWAARYGVTTPELMDPAFVTQRFVPMSAFPAAVLVDRCGTIRWRQYSADSGLFAMRAAIDDALAHPLYPECPAIN